MQKFTDTFIKSAPSGTYWEGNGFGLRVGKKSKTFIVLISSGKRLTIGRYGPGLSLATARRNAQQLQAAKTLRLYRPVAITFKCALERFLEASAAKHRPSTTEDYRLRLNRHWLPSLSSKKLSDINRNDIAKFNHPSPTEAQHALVVVKVFFSWAIKHGLTDNDPSYRMPSISRILPRSRVLEPSELSLLLQELQAAPSAFYRIVYLLILTGQRRNEIASLQWGWIKNDTITIPATVAKNRHQHTFPIGKLTQDFIDNIPKTSDYLFPAARSHVRKMPTTHFNSWSKSKLALDKRVPIAPWSLHDLRRGYSTIHAQLGTPIHITERALNHISGAISGVAATYNVFKYENELKDAVQAYEKYIASIVA